MNDKSSKLNKLREDSNAIFQELFGFGKKEPKTGDKSNLNQSGLIYEDDVVAIYPNWEVKFKKTGSVIKKPLPGYAAFTNLDWNSDGVKWLATSEFIANSVQIKDETVDRFIEGKWYSGPFKGRAFIKSEFGVKDGNKAYFAGGKLVDSIWNPSPYYFIEGTTTEVDTILGIKNISTLNQKLFNFNIISVVPGRKIIMEMENGVVHEVSVLKRLDSSNSSFNFRIKDGHSKEVFSMPLRWAALRGNSVSEFIDLTTLSNNRVPVIFSNLFNLKFDSPIARVIVTNDTEYGKKKVEVPGSEEKASEAPIETPADLTKKQVSIELSNLPFLGIEKIVRKSGPDTSLYFNFPTPQHQSAYNSVVDLINKGWIRAYITEVKNALGSKVITGAPVNFPYLASLIGKDTSIDPKLMDPNLSNAMSGLESFLRFFVNSMVRRVRKTGVEKGLFDVEDIAGKEAVRSKIKSLLGLEKAPEIAKIPTKSGNQPEKKPFKKAKFAENKEVRGIIKNILSENLKHL